LRDGFVNLVEARQNGRLSAEEFLERAESLLDRLELYPPAAVMELGTSAAKALDSTPGMAVDIVLKMISSAQREVRAVAAAMIFHFARFQPAFWVDTIKLLIMDEDWEVRDLAAHSFDTTEYGEGAAEFHFEYVLEVIEGWLKDSLAQVRRAATQSLLGYAERHPEFRPKLLEILDPLLDDPSEYVRDTHFAALRKIGKMDATLLMDYIERALPKLSDTSREALRQLLNQPFANKSPERKAELLAKLNAPKGN
jgi:3-methyladenine DNA glycosylase AlkD